MTLWGTLAAAAAFAGCATTPVPADKYARARAAIAAAEAINVDRQPQAATYLRIAREEVELAKSLMKDGDNERAGYVLLRAESDGEAAMNLAREAWAKQEAQQTIENVRQLKSQMTEGPRS
jgi:hypothetical protein